MLRPDCAIVITGATGMIGSHLVRALAGGANRLVVCDHCPPELRPDYLAGIDFTWVEPGSLMSWLDANGHEVGAIVHMGAISDTTETSLDLLEAHNVRFTLDLWERACAADWVFLYASSAATYGAGEHGFFDSDAPDYLQRLKPLNPYGWSKHTVDMAIRAHVLAGLETPRVWAGLRFFNVYGPNEEHKGHMQSLVRKIVPTIRARAPVRLFRSHLEGVADGHQLRDFIHVGDAVAMVLRALGQERLGGLFNVGTGEARSFLDLALATYAALGLTATIEFIDMPRAIRDQYQYFTQADTGKACAHGLQIACRSLERGVADYVTAMSLTGGAHG